jgi:hypothetical protein
MTMADNLRYNKKLRGTMAYQRYDNYDAIEVPFTEAIPSDYDGAMGVPITFLDKYNPEQFEILGCNDERKGDSRNVSRTGRANSIAGYIAGKRMYARILIRHRRKPAGEGTR